MRDDQEFVLDFGAQTASAQGKKKEMRCLECFCWKPAEMFGDTDDTCSDCRA